MSYRKLKAARLLGLLFTPAARLLLVIRLLQWLACVGCTTNHVIFFILIFAVDFKPLISRSLTNPLPFITPGKLKKHSFALN